MERPDIWSGLTMILLKLENEHPQSFYKRDVARESWSNYASARIFDCRWSFLCLVRRWQEERRKRTEQIDDTFSQVFGSGHSRTAVTCERRETLSFVFVKPTTRRDDAFADEKAFGRHAASTLNTFLYFTGVVGNRDTETSLHLGLSDNSRGRDRTFEWFFSVSHLYRNIYLHEQVEVVEWKYLILKRSNSE